MKKRFTFITLILSLVAVFAFSLTLVLNLNKSNQLLMEESTEIDDDTFGDLSMYDSNNEVRLLTEPAAKPIAPRIGHQVAYSDYVDGKPTKMAIRFTAAIDTYEGLTATWSRQLFNYADTEISTVSRTSSEKLELGSKQSIESKTAYSNLVTGGDTTSARSIAFDDDADEKVYPYYYFVVYTLKNIPISRTAPLKLTVSLKLSNSKGDTTTDGFTELAADKYSVYFDPGWWDEDNKCLKAYCLNSNDTDAKWIKLEPSTSGYRLDVDRDNASKIIFARINDLVDPTGTWTNVANQTSDILDLKSNIGKTCTIGLGNNYTWEATTKTYNIITVNITQGSWWFDKGEDDKPVGFRMYAKAEGKSDLWDYLTLYEPYVYKYLLPTDYETYQIARTKSDRYTNYNYSSNKSIAKNEFSVTLPEA